MTPLKIDDIDYDLADSWNVLTEKQCERSFYIYGQTMTERDQEKFDADRIILFQICSNVPLSVISGIEAHQMIDILPHLNFIFDIPHFDHNPIPSISCGASKFYGPEGMLQHSSFDEMISADTAFTRASKNKSTDHMYDLFSILWRPQRVDLKVAKKDPEKWNGEIREKFNSKICKSRVNLIKRKVPFHYIVGAYVYFWAFRHHSLEKAFPNIFDQPVVDEDKRSGNDYGWAGTLLEMSGKEFGDFDKTADKGWQTIIISISKKIDDAKELEARLAKRK